jgi:hypothetical protein
MSKRKNPAGSRDRRVLVPLSATEFQLIDYAASKSHIRGTLAWMRTKLLEAAKAKLSDEVVQDILDGRATMALMRESLGESARRQREDVRDRPAEPVQPPGRPGTAARPDRPGRAAQPEPPRSKPPARATLKLVKKTRASKPRSRR